MKKVFYAILILFLLVLVKFYASPYTIKYSVDDFNIKEVAMKDKMYFEIDYDGKTFNYMFYSGRKIFKKRVKSIKTTSKDGYLCVKPNIKGYDSYTLCSRGEDIINANNINDEQYSEIKDDFLYNKNLSSNEYVLIWKYDGFYYMNGDNYTSINIFDKDRYSNDLMFVMDKYLIFPYYSGEYQFSDLVVLDITNGKYNVIDTDYEINYDSYIVGNRKNNVYLFDNKNNKLYEINYKKRKVKVVGDEINGYIKYVNGKKVKASLSEYTKDKIKYFKEDVDKSIVINKNYFNYTLNNKVKNKYFYDSDINVIDNFKDNIYFIYKDNLYKYDNSGYKVITHYFEFNFNKDSLVFVYNK